MTPRPPRPTPFPYTTLFRSRVAMHDGVHIRPGTIDLAVDISLFVRGLPLRVDGFAVQAVLEDVCGGYGLRRQRPRQIEALLDRKSTRLNSSHPSISYAVFCL